MMLLFHFLLFLQSLCDVLIEQFIEEFIASCYISPGFICAMSMRSLLNITLSSSDVKREESTLRLTLWSKQIVAGYDVAL